MPIINNIAGHVTGYLETIYAHCVSFNRLRVETATYAKGQVIGAVWRQAQMYGNMPRLALDLVWFSKRNLKMSVLRATEV